MANFTVANGSNHNVLNWERVLNREVLKLTQFSRYFGSGPTAAIKIVSDPLRGTKPDAAGDTVYTTLLYNLQGDGVAGDSNLQGSEEDMQLFRQTITINQLRNGVKSDGRMTNQRTFINFQKEARAVLQKWGADTTDFWSANQMAGNTAVSSNNKAGMQTPTAPTSAAANMRIIYGGGSFTTEDSLSTSHTATQFFTLTMLDEAVAIAETSRPQIVPAKTSRGMKYIAILHPFQILDLRTFAGGPPGSTSIQPSPTWYDYNRAQVQGGATGSKDLIGDPAVGALGEYNNVLIFSDSRIPLAPSTTRVRRAVFFGAQAASLAFGADSGGAENLRFRMDQQEEDYKNRLGIGIRVMGGLKKNVYNSIDLGVIVLSSFAASPNSF